MNRILSNALSGALLVMVAAACTDLTVEPKSTVTDVNVFRDQASYRAFMAKIYAGLAVSGQRGPDGQPDIEGIDEGFSQYLRLYWELQELPTDEAVIGWGDIGLPEMNTQLWAVNNVFIGGMYYRVFYQVVLANEFLRQTTDAKLAERGHTSTALRAEIAQYRAEARFLRALSYWHGLDLFSRIPLLTEADILGTLPPQSTPTEVYDFIVSELNDIQADLPAAGAATYGRATPGAAQMLLAKVYLNAAVYTGTAQYAEALNAAAAVIAGPYSLNSVYRNNFLADNHTSPEIVFPITQDGIRTRTWGGMTFLVHASCGGSMTDATYGISGCWWGLRVRPEAYSRYAVGDGRSSYFHTAGQTGPAIASIGNFTDGFAAPKYANVTSTGAPGSHATHVDADFPVFRLADAYLMYAEAHLRGGGGNATTALNYVNALRVRAYGDSSGVIAAPGLTLDFILDERGRELLWEGHRRNDLIRYGRFTGSAYNWSWKGGTQAGSATQAHLNLYPIPANELIGNPNLTQNPGY